MNKQQLANKIWESANKMRSKIEANEYKDYILGFIFYKFLSDKEEEYLSNCGWEKEELPELEESDTATVEQFHSRHTRIKISVKQSHWIKQRLTVSRKHWQTKQRKKCTFTG